MSYTRTAEDWAEYFATLPADEMVAVPFIWSKEDADAALSILTGSLDVELTEEEWSRVVHNYEDNERFNDDSLETMTWILEEILKARTEQEEGK